MIWSRFNTLFHSNGLGYFAYNALSNTLLELDKARYIAMEEVRERGVCLKNFDDGFLSLLQEHKMLVAEGDEQRLLLAYQYQRNTQCFDTSSLGLTICPTLLCNFRCPYCFEHSQQECAVMTHDTVDRLFAFIGSYEEIRHLAIAWYGGEPLIAFDVIREITERINSLRIDFQGATLVTNGYLLDNEKCALLNDLKIHSVQITIDGIEAVHNARRFLASGGHTFRRILRNLDTLMNSSYEGICHIRVNIDRQNIETYAELHALLSERFKGKKLSIYAGHVDGSPDQPYDQSRCLSLKDWTEFTFDMYRRCGLMPTGDFFPARNIDSVCVATAHSRFVIGPKGELYKCWEDVGKPAMVIGNIHETEPVTNPELRAQYSIGTNPYSDPDCLACSVLPICGGGCANKRLRAKQFGEKGLEFCSPYKNNLIHYLEGYIDRFLTNDICAALLHANCDRSERNGYRVISPPRTCVEGTSCCDH